MSARLLSSAFSSPAVAGPSTRPLLTRSISKVAYYVQEKPVDPQNLESEWEAHKPEQVVRREKMTVVKANKPHRILSRGRASRQTLDSLVSLHHVSATFMHDPKEVDVGFENAYQVAESEPYFIPFGRWKNDILESIGENSTIVDKDQEGAPLGRVLARRKLLQPSQQYWQTFKKYEPSWSQGQSGGVEYKSDREVQVREALFGTWTRGGKGMNEVQPSLQGVEDWLNKKGVDEAAAAEEWRERDRSTNAE